MEVPLFINSLQKQINRMCVPVMDHTTTSHVLSTSRHSDNVFVPEITVVSVQTSFYGNECSDILLKV